MKRILMIFVFVLGLLPLHSVQAEPLSKPPEQSMEELYHDLFLTMLINEVQHHVEEYYSVLMTSKPVVYPYDIDVKKVERLYGYRSFRFIVVLEVEPAIGAHNAVGRDELTFDIHSSEAKLIQYKHLETYDIPEQQKGIPL